MWAATPTHVTDSVDSILGPNVGALQIAHSKAERLPSTALVSLLKLILLEIGRLITLSELYGNWSPIELENFVQQTRMRMTDGRDPKIHRQEYAQVWSDILLKACHRASMDEIDQSKV